MKLYKGHETLAKQALKYIEKNKIKCRYYGWEAMLGHVDLVKIDGKIRRFHVDTGVELTKEQAKSYAF